MRARGLRPSFSDEALAQLDGIRAATAPADAVDLRDLPWCSVDRPGAVGIDQLASALPLDGRGVRVAVAVADVATFVACGSPLDEHARDNASSVYTPAGVFPMLPPRLGAERTSLEPLVDRLALVAEMDVDASGRVAESRVRRGLVRSRAALAYGPLSSWLAGRQGDPSSWALGPDAGPLEASLRLQDEAARRLRARRRRRAPVAASASALTLGAVLGPDVAPSDRARAMVEDLMIAAQAALDARLGGAHGSLALRRVVRTPADWSGIVGLAAAHGAALPAAPDGTALLRWLDARRRISPSLYLELCLAVLRHLGPGAYAVEGDAPVFALLPEHVHATAPHRRFVDLVTQRLVHAALDSAPAPYTREALRAIAEHCTRREADVREVEREVREAMR